MPEYDDSTWFKTALNTPIPLFRPQYETIFIRTVPKSAGYKNVDAASNSLLR